ncbi:MAG: membrane protein insertase YidC [Bryobacteraceae bacterium]
MSDPKGTEKLTQEQRLMLAFGLMAVVLTVSTYLTPQPAPVPQKKQGEAAKTAEQKQTATQTQSSAAPATGQAKSAAAPKPVNRVEASKEETYAVETNLYRVVFSNRGATVRSWVLRKYQDSKGKELELTNPKAVGKVVPPFAIRFHAEQPSDDLNNALWAATVSPDKLTVTFEWSSGPWYGKKQFAFKQDSYVSEVSSEVRNSGVGKPHLLYWLGGFGDGTVIGATASQFSVRYDLSANKRMALAAKEARVGPDAYQAHKGRFAFAGITDSFFAALALPDTNRDFEIQSLAHDLENQTDGKVDPFVGVAIGGDAQNRFPFFVGPKETDLLTSTAPNLPKVIDYGMWSFAAAPLFQALHWFYERVVGHWGWTIVVITIVINIVLLPLRLFGYKSSKKMAALQPELALIKAKYKNLPLTDPKRQQEQQETMALYEKHGVSLLNPSGCLPLIIQLPFLVAFYNVLTSAIELRGASWLWVKDLSRPDNAFDPIRILPLLMVGTQVITTKMMPAAGPDAAQQQRIMMMSSLIFIVMFWASPSGVMLYWVTTNLVGILQQWVFNKFTPAPATASASPASPKKKGK